MTRDQGSDTRRAYLRRVAVAGVALGAGCRSLGGDGDPPDDTERAPTTAPAPDPTASADPDEDPTPTASATPTPEALTELSGTYPGYRYDASRRAYAPGTTAPADPPEVAYTVDLPGRVYQPVVRGRTLYLARAERERGEPTVTAFDLRRGTRRWTANLGSRAGAPPTVTPDRVFVQTRDGTYGLTREGDVDWETDSVATTGFAPTVTADRVYAVGGESAAAFARDGERLWSVPLSSRPYASASADGDRLYLVVPRDQATTDVLTLGATDGRTAWRRAVETRAGFPPVRASDAVYVASDRRGGGVTALSANEGDVRWTTDVTLDRGLAVTDDRVVAARGERVLGRERSDGSEAWTTGLGDEVVAGPVADDDAVYVGVRTGDRDGVVHAVDAEGGGIRWTVGLDRPVGGLPAVLDGGLLVVTDDGDETGETLSVLAGP